MTIRTIRPSLSDLESKVESRGYRITVKGEKDGSATVTLTHIGKDHIWTGVGSRTQSFPYETALKQATARMEQFENRFQS